MGYSIQKNQIVVECLRCIRGFYNVVTEGSLTLHNVNLESIVVVCNWVDGLKAT